MARRPREVLQLDTLDQVVLELMHRREESPRASASELMRDVFREQRLRPKQQKRVRDLFHAMLARGSMIERALHVGTPGEVAPALVPSLRVLAARVLAGDLTPRGASGKVAWVDWKAVANLPNEIGSIEDPVARLCALGSLPEWLVRRMVEQFGDEADAVVRGLLGRAPTTLRANTLRCTRAELEERLVDDGVKVRPTEHASCGLQVLSPAQLFRLPAFREGWFEMQDEASQMVCEVVAPPPGGLVIDACAGAGGKTLAIAAALRNKGTVLALDVDARRLGDLKTRARRAGIDNLRVQATPADAWPEDVVQLARRADRILVDAPCSGIGSLRRNPDMRSRFEEEEMGRLTTIQRDLVDRVAPLLKPKARLIYATCTVLEEENGGVVAFARERHPELEPVSVVEILGAAAAGDWADAAGCLRTLPHRHGADGFFAAVLRRPKL